MPFPLAVKAMPALNTAVVARKKASGAMNFMCRQDSGEPVGLKSRMDERPDRGDEGSKAPDEWSWPVDSPRRFAGCHRRRPLPDFGPLPDRP